jgi:hypothetical protein
MTVSQSLMTSNGSGHEDAVRETFPIRNGAVFAKTRECRLQSHLQLAVALPSFSPWLGVFSFFPSCKNKLEKMHERA